MLTAPYITGMAAAGFSGRQAGGFIAVLLLFFSRPPLALLLKRRRHRGTVRPDSFRLWLNFALTAAPGTVLLGWLTLTDDLWWLPLFGAAGLLLFGAHRLASARWRQRSAPAELLGIAMLTLTAPLADYLGSRPATRQALLLWLLNLVFFGASIFYVKMKVSAAAKRGAKLKAAGRLRLAAWSLLYTIAMVVFAVAMVATGQAPVLTPLAFAPMTGYGAFSMLTLSPVLRIKREGTVQTLITVAFTGLMVLAYRL